jgi:hypothetical protein
MPSWTSVRVVVGAALFALALHAGVVVVKTFTHPTHSVLAVFRVGGRQPWRPPFVAAEGYPLETDGYGTDGQQYLYVAHDPLLRRRDMAPAIDAPRYRYGRILLPALAAATCAGSSPCIPRAILAYNLVFAATIGALAALLVRARGAHPAWGLLLASSGALVCATDVANVELAAQAFGLLGLWLYEERRLGWAALALAAAVLARETYALLPAGIALSLLLERRARDATIVAAAVTPAVAWAAYVRLALPPDPGGGASVNLAPPFGGIAQHVVDFARHPVVTGSTVVAVLVGAPLLAMMGRHFAALRRDRSGLALATALFAVLGLCSSAQVWLRPGGFARGLDFLYPGVVLCALARRDRATALLALSTLIQAGNIVADHLLVPAPR